MSLSWNRNPYGYDFVVLVYKYMISYSPHPKLREKREHECKRRGWCVVVKHYSISSK